MLDVVLPKAGGLCAARRQIGSLVKRLNILLRSSGLCVGYCARRRKDGDPPNARIAAFRPPLICGSPSAATEPGDSNTSLFSQPQKMGSLKSMAWTRERNIYNTQLTIITGNSLITRFALPRGRAMQKKVVQSGRYVTAIATTMIGMHTHMRYI